MGGKNRRGRPLQKGRRNVAPSQTVMGLRRHIDAAIKLLTVARRALVPGGESRVYDAVRGAMREVAKATNVCEGNAGDVEWTAFRAADVTDPRVEAQPGHVGTFINSLYQVQVREFDSDISDGTMWLAIVRRDRTATHDWRHFQRIKNELIGPECEAVEVYPAEGRLVDTNNQYHLFVFPVGVLVPLGYAERDVADGNTEGTMHTQRPFDVTPEDLNARGRQETIRIIGKRREVDEEE